jgi:uncharacterized protein (TIGR03083 family)
MAAGRSTTGDLVERYADAADRFATAIGSTDLRAPVPSCPGWSAYDLVVHLGNVHAWAATILETRRRAAEHGDRPRSARPRAASRWYTGKADDLLHVLRATPPDEPCWNFAYGTGVTGFWHRRQLHETTVHQVDLDLAARRRVVLDPVQSADGVDEVLTVFLHRMHDRGHVARLHRPVALVASDTGDVWTLAPRPDAEPSVERGTSVAPSIDDRVAGRADVLYRLLWKRLAPDDPAVVIGGDRDRVLGFLGSRLVP